MAEINKQKEIKIIEDPVEAVRKLPDVYIGRTGNPGFLNMFREILQNSLDEIIKGNTLDKNIIVSYDARSHMVIIEDNGQGIDLSMLEKVFSVLHSSSNYDKVEGSGDYSSGKNGMGATITNFLSRIFIVESYRMDGTAAKVEFEEGYISKKKIQKIKCPKGKHGLITTFEPSDIMGNIDIDDEQIENLIRQLTLLSSIGTKVVYNAITPKGMKRRVIIENKHGIFEMLSGICEKPLFEPIYFSTGNGTMEIECLLTYDIKNMDDPHILSFANMCPTTGGTHVDGFLDGLIKYIRDYMNKIYLANNKKLSVTAPDIRTGLRAIVSIKHLYPLFSGQSKEYFSEASMKPYASEVTMVAIDEWTKKAPSDLQKLGKYLKEVCELRMKQDNEKIKISDKYTSSVISGMPAKYKKPNGKGPFELWIVEGDSACSCMENNRDKQHQAIFPIRGKLINALTVPTKRFFENEEVASMAKIFGYQSYQAHFDPDKFKPEKVVIATDADADGSHIASLLLMMFLKYYPFALSAGKVYVANPPLYGIPMGKNKMKFFANNIEYIEYVQSVFCKDNVIADSKKKQLTRSAIVKLLYNNMDYVKFITHVANTYAINPRFLEFLLYNRELNFNKFKSTVEKSYPFTKVTKENGIIMIHGLVDSLYQTVFFNDRLISECKPIINLIDRSDKYYYMNKKKCTLYDILYAFSQAEPSNITRYKGLGEMPPRLLGESTVIPGYGRTLKQYTTDDVKRELKYIASLQSDKSVFVQGVKVRKDDII